MTQADTNTREKLSVIPKGAWRNLWLCKCDADEFIDEAGRAIPDPVGNGAFLDKERWPSREVAEQEALKDIAIDEVRNGDGAMKYLGPVFFPAADP